MLQVLASRRRVSTGVDFYFHVTAGPYFGNAQTTLHAVNTDERSDVGGNRAVAAAGDSGVVSMVAKGVKKG